MKSRLRSLKQWFSGGSRRRTRKNSAPRRRLLLESLESRRLLTADLANLADPDDLAAIAGTVFVDLTDDGLTADDTRLEGITVNLYRDNGDQQFEGDTTRVDSVLTDSAGNYRFDQLTEGLYFVEQEAVDGLLQRPEETVRSVEITAEDAKGIRDVSIDSFGVTPQWVRASSPAPATEFVGGPAPEAVGGHRNLFVELQDGSVVAMEVMDLNPPYFSFDSHANTSGRGVITWDGGGAADQLDPTGLEGYDLTQDGTRFGIHFLQGADHTGGTIHLHVYTNGENFSTFTSAIPKTLGGAADVATEISFDDFVTAAGQGANFENVGAIQLEIEGVPAMNATIKDLGTFGPTIKTAHFANLNPLSLGDTVWFDANNNGFLDPGETGIPGVELTLYEDTDGSGDFTPGVDVPLANQTTNGDGLYLFTGLFPGNYLVQVDPANFNPGGALHEMVSSTAFDPPPDPNDDNVDGDDKGYPLQIGGVDYGVVSLAINLSAGGANTNRTLDFGFTRLADLEVVKIGVPDPVNAGEQLTYTVTVTNKGPSPADNVVLTDILPADVTFEAAESDERLQVTGNRLIADLGRLAVNDPMNVVIVVTVNSDFAGGELLNRAEVVSDTPDPVDANNVFEEQTGVAQEVALQINKTTDLAQAIAGEQLVYTLNVTNAGPSDATDVRVVDNLPGEVTYVSATTSQGVVTHDDGVVTANLGDMAADADAQLTITVLVDPAARIALLNDAQVTAQENRTPVPASVSTPVIANADLEIKKTGHPAQVVAGTQLEYELVVTNHGPSNATNVTVNDILPDGVTFNATDHPDYEIVGNVLNVDIGNLAVNASETFTVTVDVAPDTRGVLVNTATVAGDEPDPVPGNDRATVNTPVHAQIDLVIAKVGAPTPVEPGGRLTYTLNVTNNGPSQATGVTVTDPLPGGLTYVPGSGEVTGDATSGTVGASNGIMTAELGAMAPGAEAQIIFETDVAPNLVGPIINVSFVAGQEPETNLADNVASFEVQVTPPEPPVNADVAISKQVSPNPVVAGTGLTYTLTVTNNGPSPATNVVVVDDLPGQLNFTGGNTTQGDLTEAAGRVEVNVGDLAPNQVEIITINADVAPDARGVLANEANVTATEDDSNPTNNNDIANTPIIAQADLAIAKTSSDASPVPGQDLIYTLNVTNDGPSDATNVVIEDTLPGGVEFVGTDMPGITTYDNGVVTVNLGELAANDDAEIQITTRVQAGFVGTLRNSAQVWADEPDPNPRDNRASVESTVDAQASSLSGVVYVDENNDGEMQPDEARLPGVMIILTGTDRNGQQIREEMKTDASGEFRFENLPAGVYNLQQQDRPRGYFRGRNTHDPAVDVASIVGDEFRGINLGPGEDAGDFLFGHLLRVFSKRLFLSSLGD